MSYLLVSFLHFPVTFINILLFVRSKSVDKIHQREPEKGRDAAMRKKGDRVARLELIDQFVDRSTALNTEPRKNAARRKLLASAARACLFVIQMYVIFGAVSNKCLSCSAPSRKCVRQY